MTVSTKQRRNHGSSTPSSTSRDASGSEPPTAASTAPVEPHDGLGDPSGGVGEFSPNEISLAEQLRRITVAIEDKREELATLAAEAEATEALLVANAARRTRLEADLRELPSRRTNAQAEAVILRSEQAHARLAELDALEREQGATLTHLTGEAERLQRERDRLAATAVDVERLLPALETRRRETTEALGRQVIAEQLATIATRKADLAAAEAALTQAKDAFFATQQRAQDAIRDAQAARLLTQEQWIETQVSVETDPTVETMTAYASYLRVFAKNTGKIRGMVGGALTAAVLSLPQNAIGAAITWSTPDYAYPLLRAAATADLICQTIAEQQAQRP
jgi:hypothetical protein